MKTKHLLTSAILPLLLLFSASLPAQPIDWDGVRQAYIDKYQPQQMPAWLFPIIFEDGTGARDTIYLGYDPEAHLNFFQGNDSIFGEVKEYIDTTQFNAHWETNVNNYVAKVFITNKFQGFSISFHKGYLPLTMYWDRHAFYDPALPFPDQSPAPRAQGESGAHMASVGTENMHYCAQTDFILMTDSILGKPSSDAQCIRTDSIVYDDLFFDYKYVSTIYSFKIQPWRGVMTGMGIKNSNKQLPYLFYPNPARDYIYFKPDNPSSFQFEIFSLEGRKVSTGKLPGTGKINLSHLPDGYYLISILSENYTQRQRLIISR